MRHGWLLPAALGLAWGLLDLCLFLSGLELLGMLFTHFFLEDL